MERDRLLESNIKNAIHRFPGKASAVIETANNRIDVGGNLKMRSASTIKLAVLLEAYHQVDQKELALHEMVEFKPEDFAEGSGVLFHLNSVKEMSVEDLLTLMIIVSDNTASNLAIRKVGIGKVNALMTELDCSETGLEREFMDFAAIRKGLDNFTSSADLVRMLKAVDSGELLSPDSRQQVLHVLKQQQFIANLHGRFDEDDEVTIASKSGGLPGVVNDAGIFEYRGHKVYAAVLLDESLDNHTGQELIAQIGKYIYDWLKAI